jgi:hypothetical protein
MPRARAPLRPVPRIRPHDTLDPPRHPPRRLPVVVARAQEPKLEFPQASPAASVKQRIGLTDVEVEYSRPSVKARKIFGGLVPYGEVWRTGANTATKLTFSADVKLEGTPVPAGSYALYTIPGENEWVVILSKVTGQWGSYQYDEKNDLLRAKVKPIALKDPVETMSISLEEVRDDAAQLAITWDKTRVTAKIETDLVAVMVPQIKTAMAGDAKKKPYFQAAMFYYEHNLDLKQALAWMDEAVKEQPDAVDRLPQGARPGEGRRQEGGRWLRRSRRSSSRRRPAGRPARSTRASLSR